MKMECKSEIENCNQSESHRRFTFGKLFWGLLIICGAGALLLNGLGIDIISSLPVVRIIGSILLLAMAISSLAHFRFVLFFVPLTFIAYIWRTELGIQPDNFHLWPVLGAAVLLGIGLSVIFHRKNHYHVTVDGSNNMGSTTETLNENEFVNIDAGWGDHIKYVHADNLKQANIKSSFAQTKVYFDECKVSPEGLSINVNASFTELVLNVPRTWVITTRTSTFAGHTENRQPARSEGSIEVSLTGTVNFAELRINYV